MKLLAFDTSSSRASIALGQDNDVMAEIHFEVGIAHSKELLVQIDRLLQLVNWSVQDLDAIAVGVGPGLFTGLRVGIATAQGLAFAAGCPLIGLPSLEARALSGPNGTSLLAVCMDARKKELYTRLFKRSHLANPGEAEDQESCHPIPMGPARLLSAEKLAKELKEQDEAVTIIGNGGTLYKEIFKEELAGRLSTPGPLFGQRLSGSALISLTQREFPQQKELSPWQIEPLYIRPSEAEWKIGPPEGGPPVKDRFQDDGTILPASETDTPNNK